MAYILTVLVLVIYCINLNFFALMKKVLIDSPFFFFISYTHFNRNIILLNYFLFYGICLFLNLIK